MGVAYGVVRLHSAAIAVIFFVILPLSVTGIFAMPDVLGLVTFGVLIGSQCIGRALFYLARRDFRVTDIHHLLQQGLCIGGPRGYQLQPLPPEAVRLTSSLELVPLRSDGWYVWIAHRDAGYPHVGFCNWPESKQLRRDRLRHLQLTLAHAQVRKLTTRCTTSDEHERRVEVYIRECVLPNSGAYAVAVELLTAQARKIGDGWTVDYAVEFEARRRRKPLGYKARMVGREIVTNDPPEVVDVRGESYSHLSGEPEDHALEFEAFVGSVRPSARPAAAEAGAKP